MQIAVESEETGTVFFLSGDLDRDTGPGVYLAFQRELSRGARRCVFDLNRVDMVDSAGLGVLVRCYRDARMRGAWVVLERVPEPIRHVLEFTRLDTILPIAEGDLVSASEE